MLPKKGENHVKGSDAENKDDEERDQELEREYRAKKYPGLHIPN
ncbi:hypothetical protein AX774_g6418, partial [Zancudomyces culisetae]